MWNLLVRMASIRTGLYYYFLPTYTQGKKIIWEGITNDGMRFLDFVPKEMLDGEPNGSELKLKLRNGSIIQIIGTDNYDAVRGTNPIGCVFSEYAYQNPMAWEVVKPILRVNGGWAIFNSTPNGKNHFCDLLLMAEQNSAWFAERLTIRDTGVLGEADMDLERKEGMSEEMIQQEYYVSFDIGTLGAYYSKQLAELNGRNGVCAIPIDAAREVDVFFDLGKNDATTLGFLQVVGKEYRIIDAYDGVNQDISHYAEKIKSKGYNIRWLYLPHDAFARRLESPKTIAEQFELYDFKIKRVPKLDINSGIQQVRKMFPMLWFDRERCKQLLRALENYHHEYDDIKKVFKEEPFHDWSSHYADMIRYLCVGVSEKQQTAQLPEAQAANEYIGKRGIINPLTHQIDTRRVINDYTGQAENYINM
jgi:phage terminase large subunit